MRSVCLARTTAAALLIACAAQARAEGSAVLSYNASFFADQRPNTASDMVGRVPGFTFTDVSTARGFAGTAGNVLINGQRPTSKSDTLQSILERIPAANVDRIELIRGGAPGIDMQGQTVVVNVILKQTNSTTWVATAENLVFLDGHMVPNGDLEFTQHSGPATYEGSISAVQNYDDSVGHGYHDVFDGSGNLLSHDFAISHGLGIGVAGKGAATVPLWGGEFKANLTLQTSPFVDRLAYSRPGFLETFKDDSRTNSGELGLHWKGRLTDTIELETLALQRLSHDNAASYSNDSVTAQYFASQDHSGESIGRATLSYAPSPRLDIEGGGEAVYNFLDGESAFSINGVNQPLPTPNPKVEEHRGEAFAQGTWKFTDDWTLEAGMRAEVSRISESGSTHIARSFFYPKPRGVLTWAPDKDTQVRLRYEKIVGQLDFNNFIAQANLSSTGVTAGNANLRPDQHTQYEVSFERHFWDKGAIVLTLMHEDIKDVVDLVPITNMSGTFDAPGNIGNGQDTQITVQGTLPLDRFYIQGGLLTTTSIFNLTSVRDPVTGDHRVISGQRPQNIKVNFTEDIGSLNSTWGIFYYNCWDEKYFRLEQVRHRKVTPPYFSAFWDYTPSPSWSFHLEADDLTGFVYKDTKFNYTAPRNVAPVDNVDEFVADAIPQIDFKIRYTF